MNWVTRWFERNKKRQEATLYPAQVLDQEFREFAEANGLERSKGQSDAPSWTFSLFNRCLALVVSIDWKESFLQICLCRIDVFTVDEVLAFGEMHRHNTYIDFDRLIGARIEPGDRDKWKTLKKRYSYADDNGSRIRARILLEFMQKYAADLLAGDLSAFEEFPSSRSET